jgi:hypothetical protein
MFTIVAFLAHQNVTNDVITGSLVLNLSYTIMVQVAIPMFVSFGNGQLRFAHGVEPAIGSNN